MASSADEYPGDARSRQDRASGKTGKTATHRAAAVALSRARTTKTAGYAGPERRKPTPLPKLSTQILRTAGAVVLVLALWIATVLMVDAQSQAAVHSLISASQSITGALLLIGAALAFANWRVTRASRTACAVIALTGAGLSTPLTGVLARSAASGLTDSASSGLLPSAVELVAIVCVGAALLMPAVNTRFSPLRYATPLVALTVLGAGFVLARGDRPSPAWLGEADDVLRIADAAGWVLLAVAFTIHGARRHRRTDVLLGCALLLPAAAAAARYRLGPSGYQVNLIAVGFDLALAATVAGVAAVALWSVHVSNTIRLHSMVTELQETRSDLAVLESVQDRRLHDARNAIFAIAGAVDLLATPAPHNTLAPTNLQRLITAELNRLGHLLDPGFHGEVSTFTVGELFGPLIGAYRAQGLTITENLDGSRITGRRDLIAGAVTNILTNARVHAPGSRIWVTTATVYDTTLGKLAVRIDIADDGPGIPPSERDRVLLPGVRGIGVAVPGSGLGLASAAQALSEAGGTLRLSERKGGGTMISLTIPHAGAADGAAGNAAGDATR